MQYGSQIISILGKKNKHNIENDFDQKLNLTK